MVLGSEFAVCFAKFVEAHIVLSENQKAENQENKAVSENYLTPATYMVFVRVINLSM